MFNYFTYSKLVNKESEAVQAVKMQKDQKKIKEEMVQNHKKRVMASIFKIAANPKQFEIHDAENIVNSRERYLKESKSCMLYTQKERYKVQNYVSQAHKSVWDIIPDKFTQNFHDKRDKHLAQEIIKKDKEAFPAIPNQIDTSDSLLLKTKNEKVFRIFAKNPYTSTQTSEFLDMKKRKSKVSKQVCTQEKLLQIAPIKSIITIAQDPRCIIDEDTEVIRYGLQSAKAKFSNKKLALENYNYNLKNSSSSFYCGWKKDATNKISNKTKSRAMNTSSRNSNNGTNLITKEGFNYAEGTENMIMLTDNEKQVLKAFVTAEESLEIIRQNPILLPIKMANYDLKKDNPKDEEYVQRLNHLKVIAFGTEGKSVTKTSFLQKLKSKKYKMKRTPNKDPVEYFLRFNKAACEDLRRNLKSEDDIWIGGKVFHKSNIQDISKQLLNSCNIITPKYRTIQN